ncbi:MAG TPA: MT-A70 family methyltransferase, partial [Anaerovoracaceae bacterium]|nr:MT-A70 family methyltransferase [Anaerovoracaceae bacterium]
MKYDVIVSDPPWEFSDRLEMSKVKRGAAANYSLLSNQAIKELDVKTLAADNAALVLWIPSSLLSLGIEVMDAWGFRQTQTWIWVKTKKDPFEEAKRAIRKKASKKMVSVADIDKCLDAFSLNETMAFGMGRMFRQCHEIALVGVRGKAYNSLKNKSQRSVLFDLNLKHSRKPEGLQDRLDLMFPKGNKLEMFARRDRDEWTC